MSADHRNLPETPEGAAWELFLEIQRAEEKEGQSRGRGNRRTRDELLALYAECLTAARGDRRQLDGDATVH